MAGPAAAAGEATASGVRNETTTKRTSDNATQPVRGALTSVGLMRSECQHSAMRSQAFDQPFPLAALVRPQHRDRSLEHVAVVTRRTVERKRDAIQNRLAHADPRRAARFSAWL